jgi:hypothetical protein
MKEILSAAGIALTLIAYYPYIRSITRGNTRPHVFSWVIWGSVTVIVFLAQLAGGGGLGAWPIGVSGLISIYVAVLAWVRRSDFTISRLDWLFFVLAISALPLWFFTADPLWAVVILTTVDTLGFGPTFRKAYRLPFEEHLLFFVLIALRNLISIAALELYSVTTVLFPAVTAAACAVFIAMVVWRRQTPGRVSAG